MSAVLVDFQAKGLLVQTRVVLGTEFGRTPRLNENEGREHDDEVVTCLLAGAGRPDAGGAGHRVGPHSADQRQAGPQQSGVGYCHGWPHLDSGRETAEGYCGGEQTDVTM